MPLFLLVMMQLGGAEANGTFTLGDPTSEIEVYIFTDWECPHCKKLEPFFEKTAPSLMKDAKVAFIDVPIHPSTRNYYPYHLSFLVNDKENYLKLRGLIDKISETVSNPTDGQIREMAASVGVSYQALPASQVEEGIEFFTDAIKKFNIRGTPTVVVINTNTNKAKKLIGPTQITESNVLRTIKSLRE